MLQRAFILMIEKRIIMLEILILLRHIFASIIIGALPYQCALQFRSTGFSYCGAALIDPLKTGSAKWVITADHCVKDR